MPITGGQRRRNSTKKPKQKKRVKTSKGNKKLRESNIKTRMQLGKQKPRVSIKLQSDEKLGGTNIENLDNRNRDNSVKSYLVQLFSFLVF